MLTAMVVLLAGLASARAVGPSLWITSTDCGSTGSNTNHYIAGETVYIHVSGFTAGTYNWDVRENPFQDADKVIFGSKIVDSSGTLCFEAYPTTESGEYKAYFGNEKQNFHVDALATVPEFGPMVGYTNSTRCIRGVLCC